EQVDVSPRLGVAGWRQIGREPDQRTEAATLGDGQITEVATGERPPHDLEPWPERHRAIAAVAPRQVNRRPQPRRRSSDLERQAALADARRSGDQRDARRAARGVT